MSESEESAFRWWFVELMDQCDSLCENVAILILETPYGKLAGSLRNLFKFPFSNWNGSRWKAGSTRSKWNRKVKAMAGVDNIEGWGLFRTSSNDESNPADSDPAVASAMTISIQLFSYILIILIQCMQIYKACITSCHEQNIQVIFLILSNVMVSLTEIYKHVEISSSRPSVVMCIADARTRLEFYY